MQEGLILAIKPTQATLKAQPARPPNKLVDQADIPANVKTKRSGLPNANLPPVKKGKR